MSTRKALLVVSALTLATVLRAQAPAQSGSSTFPLLDGKSQPLTLHLKDLDSNWRVFSAVSGSYQDMLASAMTGGAGNHVYTKGDTVTVGNEVFLVTYKPEAPDVSSMFTQGGGMPKSRSLTEDTVLQLSLLNLHSLGAMDGIRIFDLKAEVASGQKATSIIDMISKSSAGGGAESSTSEPGEPALLKNGTIAPDFMVRDDKGAEVKLSSYRGKVVVLDFWSTWCGPCQMSLPGTNALAAKYKGKKVVVLGVNVWDKQDAFHKWLPDHKALSSIKFVIDTREQPNDVASKLYHVSGIPTQYVIDAKGNIVKSLVGYSEDESELTKGIKAALAKG